jgi:putative DNA primase/helicase
MNREIALAFLRTLFGDPAIRARGLYIVVWSTPPKRATFHATPEEAADEAIRRCRRNENVYVGMGLLREPKSAGQRGSAGDVAAIVGLWADVDVRSDDAPATKVLPPTVEDAIALANEIGVAPSLIVGSGRGIHAHWLFDNPWYLASESERQLAANTARGWVQTLQQLARGHGWTIDPVGDLSRVLRVPGTLNFKRPDQPAPVRIINPGDQP